MQWLRQLFLALAGECKEQKINTEYLNHTHLKDNDCFGCGPINKQGLNIKVFRDPEDEGHLLGKLDTKPHLTGFPGMTHGGIIYTAMDCMASWAPTILQSDLPAAWVLRNANVNYLRPMRGAQTISLSAKIKEAMPAWKAVSVQVEARDQEGLLLVSGRFKMIPLSLERFKKVAGLEKVPENWKALLGDKG